MNQMKSDVLNLIDNPWCWVEIFTSEEINQQE